MRISIIGTGNVGTALALELRKAGYTIHALADRSIKTVRRIGRLTGCPNVYGGIRQGCFDKADIVIYAVKDEDIPQAVRESRRFNIPPGAILAHTSGAITSSVLSGTGIKKTNLASLHPIQTIPFRDFGRSGFLRNIYFGIEGGSAAIKALKKVIKKLKSDFIVIPGKAKPEYHLSCVLASNFILANFYLTELISKSTGISADKLFAAQEPLLRTTLENLKKRGAAGSITGPLARGDAETIKIHLDVMHRKYPEFVEYYRSASRALMKAVLTRNKKLDTEKLTKLIGK